MITPDQVATEFAGLITPHLVDLSAPAFYLLARSDRAIISVNPRNLKNHERVTSRAFAAHLATNLGDVRVEIANSRGIIFQIGYTHEKPPRLGEKYSLDLAKQPAPLTVPVGQTLTGPLWVPIGETGNVLIGGSSGFGKTILLHGWIRALMRSQGQDCRLIIEDGKRGNHFRRYADRPGVTVSTDVEKTLDELGKEIARRQDLLASNKVFDFESFNRTVAWLEPMTPIVLIVDEVHALRGELAQKLGDLIRVGREEGLIAVCATQRTSADDVHPAIKINLQTRICFAVPQDSDSRVVLNRPGAEALPKIRGRLLITWDAKLIEAQAYHVDLVADDDRPAYPTGSDHQLAARLVAETGGRVSIPLLVEWGWSRYRAERLLNAWQANGWLDGSGQGSARALAPWVLERINESLKVSESLKVDLGPAWPANHPVFAE